MRFQNPAPGIWNIYVSDDGVGNRELDLWLPITNFISEDTFFLESTPYNTLVAPSNTGLLISCGSYNSSTGSLAIDSSRGFPRNAVKPDFTAPGVEILGPLPRKRYGRKSGTSVSGAITASMSSETRCIHTHRTNLCTFQSLRSALSSVGWCSRLQLQT